MEQKANKFIALLVKKFNNAGLEASELKQAYLTVVTSLKAGHLKTELLKNSSRYKDKFQRKCQRSYHDTNTEATVLKTSCQRVHKKLAVLTPTCPQYTQLAEQLHQVKQKKLLYPELGALCSLLCSREDFSALNNTMVIIFSVLQPAVELCLDKNDHKRCRELSWELRHLLNFIHLKNFVLKSRQSKMEMECGSIKYNDILVSLLSLYLDLCLSVSRIDGEECDGDFDNSEVCGFICHLAHNLSLLDVLLQTSGFTSADKDVILPIARKCLLTVPDSLDYKLYTKFMVCAHSVVKSLGEEDTKDISQVAESVRAPNGYLAWLREQNKDILESLPEDRKFKGRRISQFIMRDGNTDLMEALLDCVTEELPEPDFVKTDSLKKVNFPSANEKNLVMNPPLFFMDTTGQKSKAETGLENSSPSIKDKTENHGEIEIIEPDLSSFSRQLESQDREMEGDTSNEENPSSVDQEEKDLEKLSPSIEDETDDHGEIEIIADLSAFPRQPESQDREREDNSSDEESLSSVDQSDVEEVTPSKKTVIENRVLRSTKKPVVPSLSKYNLRKKKTPSWRVVCL